MHESSITFQDKISGTPTHLLYGMQASTLVTGFCREREHVASAVADEGLGIRTEPGHDRFAGMPGCHRITCRIQHFQDYALAHQQHLPSWAFMRGKTDIPAAEFVRHWHCKNFTD